MANVEVPSTSEYIIIAFVNALSAFTTIAFNSLTIQAIRKNSSLSKPLKTLLLSLAISDVAVGLVVQPIFIVNLNIWKETVDTVFWFVQAAFVNASFLGVMALNLDRFLAVHLHLRYQELVTNKRVLGVAILAWVVSALITFFCFLIAKITNKHKNIQIIVWSLCFIVITVISFRLYFAVRRHANHIKALQVQQAAQNGELAKATRLNKSAVSTFYVYLVFLVCYLPYHASLLIMAMSNDRPTWQRWSQTLMFINSWLNPIIYLWRMKDIRQSIRSILMRNIFCET
ncbi:adenosine receptor A2b-like [Stylophora pistillata]|uniref:adenosine receptor A2b-like n=1 Tax=Stylophora pistillata TaxID=50429 RepID=UPI000C04F384|nr:adenosine receptor A2b-like [Stylophora pistillata]